MSNAPNNRHSEWELPSTGRPPSTLWLALLLVTPLFVWTFPQTMVGLFCCLYRCTQGYRPYLYGFGPFIFIVIRARGPLSKGISLGFFIFSETAEILKHEFCHQFTALWLAWFYLPVYGLEYALFGHDRSPHERLTCWIERRIKWSYRSY